MFEKRRSNRIPVHMQLSISDLFNQELSGIHHLDAPIEVVDISRHGIGFLTECILPINYYFNAKLDIEDEASASIFTIVKIVRFEIVDKDLYHYGCEFSNLPENLADIVEKYATKPDAT